MLASSFIAVDGHGGVGGGDGEDLLRTAVTIYVDKCMSIYKLNVLVTH